MTQAYLSTEQSGEIYTVSSLNQEAALLLEGSFACVWINGEISNLTKHRSGHWYFDLKDENARIKCVMFRFRNQVLKFDVDNGIQVLVRAKVSLYKPSGTYQLQIETMEETGLGTLQRQFEALKQQLQKEGLFDPKHKQAIPSWPTCIGVITSSTGAAVRDVLTVLNRRFPGIPVVIYPSQVQGEKAASELIQAIQIANTRAECDVIILTRGGGSIEDLWCFNAENLARVIFKSEIPIISAVGHEVDFTIADFVADVRAATPSAAAELASPDQREYLDTILQYQHRLYVGLIKQIESYRSQLQHLSKRLRSPRDKLNEKRQTLDHVSMHFQHVMLAYLQKIRGKFQSLNQRLLIKNPSARIETVKLKHSQLNSSLIKYQVALVRTKQQQLATITARLHAVSPLTTLARGYSITFDESNHVIRTVKQVKKGQITITQLPDGKLISNLINIDKTGLVA